MSGVATYLWIVEWDDSFVQPARVEVRQVTRRPGVSDKDLEHHLVHVEIPQQAAVSTRATAAVAYSLSDLGPLTNGLSRR